MKTTRQRSVGVDHSRQGASKLERSSSSSSVSHVTAPITQALRMFDAFLHAMVTQFFLLEIQTMHVPVCFSRTVNIIGSR